ncbi:uncharacterized protein LOC129947141 [Eupeodes corollae]|uniref:uncharacterized protein LOC129947141 n=1 Tax=Eupeodes corollae TaxID=290404 RepID=UPI00248FB4E6|nr:uncharacterized protein LOC129947141 [Eupeodes corollae]
MKILLILALATLAYSAKLNNNQPTSNNLDLLRSRNLLDDFRDIKALIPQREIIDLIRRYLKNDEEFKRIILYFGSSDVYNAGRIIAKQPELREFYGWLKKQIRASLDSLNNLSDDSYSEEYGNLLNYKPNQQQQQQQLQSLRGWKGFMEELLAIYPNKKIENLIRDKVAANGVFAEFWRKITALRPVYERILKTDEVIKVIGRLRKLGVDTKQLDQLIREDFGWKAVGLGASSGEEQKLLGNSKYQNYNPSKGQKAPLA